MLSGCYIRALWILTIRTLKFPVVEKRCRVACEKENTDDLKYHMLPNDSDFGGAFSDRKKRILEKTLLSVSMSFDFLLAPALHYWEGSARGFGVRVSQSVKGSDSWVDDPIARHVISLYINKEEGENNLLWPLVLHIKGPYSILILPLVEPRHLKSYSRMCNTSECGNAIGADESLSSLLLDLPSITGAFAVAQTIGDIVVGETTEPEVVVAASPSVGGLLDTLTGSIGISSISVRAKPVALPVATSTISGTAVTGTAMSDDPKMGSRPLDKDVLRSFISSAMPFGPLDLSYSNISAIKTTGFSSADVPPADRKQPAWKPYLYRGKQRILFTIHDTVHAAIAELEGLPDVSLPLTWWLVRVESLTFILLVLKFQSMVV
ncbi:hypothetical protein SASPL_112344 [Salvia splendens]|uniref:Uncharacterized protein n=1 Tax=Salvia splendens TaxID=180675 RepID=A0A8X8Y9V4_SALSN|nr:hypothetical protein SASPL_112344 [Salvia splendens]